jgi:mannose/fructose/N-acetylgalactosamine-specific phosphotransferase system component IID
MTTKEEVLRLALESGFDSYIENNDIEHIGVFSDTEFKEGYFMSLTPYIEKLIELAKAQGAVEEQEAGAKWRFNYELIFCALMAKKQNAIENNKENDSVFIEKSVKNIEAIRNRERKE